MAKAKKSESKTETTPSAKKKTGEKKPAEKKKSSASVSTQGTPSVDTNLAAQAAARMLTAGAHAKASQTSGSAEPRQESSMFKQLKAGLNKPSSSAMGNMLDKSGGLNPKKSNLPFGGKQVGHNQTFGSNVTRSGVPRRTSG